MVELGEQNSRVQRSAGASSGVEAGPAPFLRGPKVSGGLIGFGVPRRGMSQQLLFLAPHPVGVTDGVLRVELSGRGVCCPGVLGVHVSLLLKSGARQMTSRAPEIIFLFHFKLCVFQCFMGPLLWRALCKTIDTPNPHLVCP